MVPASCDEHADICNQIVSALADHRIGRRTIHKK